MTSSKKKSSSSSTSKTSSKKSRASAPKAPRESLQQFKMEAAREVGVSLKSGDNGNLTSRQAGSVGGQMVKKMIESYESKKG